ncbi:HlyB/MsbA family ABC transporter [Deinococcus seoulensis]|uniref:HlyB/MsbA family ABC transporter n=1 Tax=Deinococcus seoulensis TaxID=1837379 RepID=A0ABQ2S0J3_9DEIO|nr:ABC transporter ATP-binding protein [Deinococcus seoulensis]GGR76615.1 HlyB/MsbA family ABC transporter [Deinococcus seoulensis]
MWLSEERRQALSLSWRGISYVARHARGDVTKILLLNLFYATGPLLILLVSKYVIDHIDTFRADRAAAVQFILMASLVYLVLNIVTDSFQTVMGLYMDNLRDKTRYFAKKDLMERVSAVEDISIFEDPGKLDTLLLAEEGVKKLWELNASAIRLFIGVAGLLPSLLVLFGAAWWIPLLVLAFAVPSIYAQGEIEDESWSVERSHAETLRKNKIFETNILGVKGHKDVKVYGAAPFFITRWMNQSLDVLAQMQRVRRRGAQKTIGWSILSSLGTSAPYIFVLFQYIDGRFSLGDLALYSGLIFQFRRSLEDTIFQGSEVYQAGLSTEPFWDIKQFQSQIAPGQGVVPLATKNVLAFQDVHFTYPGAERATLTGIHARFEQDRLTVIVGENGAGKTTLAKLVCRLYDPTAGHVQLNGQDLRGINVQAYRERIAAVFQDFGRFEDTVDSNLFFKQEVPDASGLLSAVGLTDQVSMWEQGTSTMLSNQFKGGTDLSGGQWQRLAIARAMARLQEAAVVLLDEPTSALDPETEHEAFALFRQMCQGKIGIVISHRMSLCRHADHIIVMGGGQVLEEGHHTTLMARSDSHYRRMFLLQASSYTDLPEAVI